MVLFNLVSRNPVTKVTPILLLTPVVSLICGVITLHEEIGIQEVMGAAATIMGALLVTLAARQKPLLMDAQTT